MALPLIIHCPSCGLQHIDAGEWATRPHRTHACVTTPDGVGCDFKWRPANIETVGVKRLPDMSVDEHVTDILNLASKTASASTMLATLRKQIDFISKGTQNRTQANAFLELGYTIDDVLKELEP